MLIYAEINDLSFQCGIFPRDDDAVDGLKTIGVT